MAATLKIKTGSKLQIAYDVPAGKDPDFCLVCTFFKELSESSFLVSIPMKDGKTLEMDESQKLLIRYSQGDNPMILAGFVDEVVKQGLRKYWRIRRVSEQRSFFQRSDARVKSTFHLLYSQPTWPVNYDGVIEPEDALTLDISAGGLAMYLNHVFDVGETCEVTLPPMGTTKTGQGMTLLAENCWNRKAEKGSLYKNICGLKFRFKSDAERKRLEKYVGIVKKYSA